MMLFETRRDKLREDALMYIKIHLEEGEKFIISGIYEYFENNGETQVCEVEAVTREDVIHRGTLSTEIDTDELHTVSTDLLCKIADKMHLEPLNYIKK